MKHDQMEKVGANVESATQAAPQVDTIHWPWNWQTLLSNPALLNNLEQNWEPQVPLLPQLLASTGSSEEKPRGRNSGI